MKTLLTLPIIMLSLASCTIGGQTPEDKAESEANAAYRLEVLKVCLSLAADINKAQTTHYSDLDEVVDSCGNQAYNITNIRNP